ncbi:zinc finger protein SNAI3 [Xenopus laevis]|uniref:Zinc finger protein SNAI3 n=1 Tax=Xenopus laevis TaxID=8355 RepID=A0A8J0TXP4_XENLA|nr:zinc finger protein SNAI3 [Xenopus laevis]OCT57392.1 hypothetical protein XELAEV_18003592mg [Xenopus laevis]
MPRSFLVKKPCSYRIPNYGQLLEAQADGNTSCFSCTGLMLSLLQNEDSSSPSGTNSDSREHWGAFPVPSQPLEDTGQKEYLDKASQLFLGNRMGDALPTGLPLKDNMNNLNLPIRRRPTDVMPGFKNAPFMPLQRETEQQSNIFGCSDFHITYGMLANNKTQHCHGPAHRLFTCQHCAKAYSSLGALKMHIRTHTLPCTCRICGKAFSRPWLLQGHIRTHTGEKPFSCFHCGRGFADRSNLRAHLQTHSEIKRYQCPGCGKTFSRISLLAKHRDGCCCPVS